MVFQRSEFPQHQGPEPARAALQAAQVVVLCLIWLLAGCAEADTGYLPGGPGAAPRANAGGDFRLRAHERPRDREKLRFAIAPTLAPETIYAQYEPVARYLQSVLDIPVDLEVLESYDAVIDAAVHGKVELALVPPFSYVQARARQPDLRLLASVINNGRTGYSGFLLVRSDDPATGIPDLKGRRIGLVDRNSTSGYLLPVAALKRLGFKPEKHFSEIKFAGSHTRVLELLTNGEVDVAATSSEAFGMFRQEQRPKQGAIPSGLRILYKTGEIPFDAMCATSAVPDAAIEKISGAFIHMHHRNPAAHKALGSGLKISGWAPPQDARYNVIRNVVPELYGQDRRGQ